MSYRQFLEICRREFEFLKKEYQFNVAKPSNDGSNYSYSMLNGTTGIIVEYELRENRLFLLVCRLQMGAFPPSIGEMRPDSILNCFDLEDFLVIRSQQTQTLLPIGQITSSNPLDGVISNMASLLLRVGEDTLRGDFAIFSELEPIVKERARGNAFQKWGDKAREFGW